MIYENEDGSEYVPGHLASGHNGSLVPWVPEPSNPVPCPGPVAARIKAARDALKAKAEQREMARGWSHILAGR